MTIGMGQRFYRSIADSYLGYDQKFKKFDFKQARSSLKMRSLLAAVVKMSVDAYLRTLKRVFS